MSSETVAGIDRGIGHSSSVGVIIRTRARRTSRRTRPVRRMIPRACPAPIGAATATGSIEAAGLSRSAGAGPGRRRGSAGQLASRSRRSWRSGGGPGGRSSRPARRDRSGPPRGTRTAREGLCGADRAAPGRGSIIPQTPLQHVNPLEHPIMRAPAVWGSPNGHRHARHRRHRHQRDSPEPGRRRRGHRARRAVSTTDPMRSTSPGWAIDDAATIDEVAVRARLPEDFDTSACSASPVIEPG